MAIGRVLTHFSMKQIGNKTSLINSLPSLVANLVSYETLDRGVTASNPNSACIL